MRDVILKYRHFLLPLALVAVFDLTLLGMNFVLSAQLEASSININIAGRQRMLSQKMSKEVLMLHYQTEQGLNNTDLIFNLEQTIALFDETLTAFSQGGLATSADGKEITIKPQIRTEIMQTLMQAQALWKPMHAQLKALLISEAALPQAMQMVVEHNPALLVLMNTLTNQLERRAKQQTYLLRGLQTVFVLLILLSFVMAVKRLVRREQYYTQLMEKSSDIVVGLDAASADITFISASVKLLLNHDEHYYLNKPLTRLFDSASSSRLRNLLTGVYKRGVLPYHRCDVLLNRADGDSIVAEMVMQITRSEDGKTIEVSGDIRDISERKQLELSLTELAHKDPLTGLSNRAQFRQMAEQALHHARRQREEVAIMFIDLDNFKAVNDQFGHAVGDKLLTETAKRIQQNLRQDDNVSRIGGDEFIVLLAGRSSVTSLGIVAEKIISALSVEFLIENNVCQIGASIGVARFPRDGSTVDLLVKSADNAMYEAKRKGKNTVAFSDEPVGG